MRTQGYLKQKIKHLLFIFIKNIHNPLLFICQDLHNLYKITKNMGFFVFRINTIRNLILLKLKQVERDKRATCPTVTDIMKEENLWIM